MEPVSNRNIRINYWLLTHREQLRWVGVAALAIIAAGFMGYALWQAVDIISSRRAEEEALKQLVENSFNTDLRQMLSPQPIVVGTVTAVPTSQGLYDIVAEIKNPNYKWAVRELPFTFQVGETEVGGKTFLLPLEEKYAVSLSVSLQIKPQNIEFVMGQPSWMKIRDLSELQTPSFDVSDQKIEKLTSADNSSAGSQLAFKLTNTSPYSFWQTTVTVVLSAGGSVQAVGQQVLTNVDTQGEYSVAFRWPNETLRVDNVVVKPEVNILDPRSFK